MVMSCRTERSITACLRNSTVIPGRRAASNPESRDCCLPSPTRPVMTSSLRLRGIALHGIDPQHGFGLFPRLDVKVDCDRLAVTAHQHAFQHLVGAGVDLL